MLEDIRGHSPTPDEQEIRWMAAQPFRQAARVAMLVVVATVLANAPGLLPPATAADKAIEIAHADCDSKQRTVRIEGRNLATRGLQPALYLDGHPSALATTHVSDGRIVARLPEGLADGQYTIRLHRGGTPAQWREIAVVLGVVGPVVVE
jgi:hypothetical protein